MHIATLSADALSLLRRRLAGDWVGVTEQNRPVYRELVAAGLMYPVSTFLHGSEGYYRPTDEACERRAQFTSPCTRLPAREAAPAPRG